MDTGVKAFFGLKSGGGRAPRPPGCYGPVLERFHQRCLRSILKIQWTDYVTTVVVVEQADTISIEAML